MSALDKVLELWISTALEVATRNLPQMSIVEKQPIQHTVADLLAAGLNYSHCTLQNLYPWADLFKLHC